MKKGRYLVYASDYATLSSDVKVGGGTDDTQAIQAVLDKAPEWGGLHLVMDGAALTTGLDIHSNTTIECESKDCGFFLASGANRSVVQNAHPDFKVRHDRNIALLGGTYNHNCAGQLHHRDLDTTVGEAFGTQKWSIAMEFYGVEHLTMRGVTIRNQRTFAMLVANWYRVTMEDITIELPDNLFGQNQDGIHFWGPGQYLNMRNIMGSSGDDFIALAPDEDDSVSSITDVLIDGVFLDNADQGIRMLSRGKGRLDRVTVRNVSGTFKSFGFYINPWFPGEGGSFGSIVIENVDLRQTTHKYDYTNPFLFRIGGNIEALTLRNISHHSSSTHIPVLEVGIPFYTPNDEVSFKYSHIGLLTVDGLQVFADCAGGEDSSYIKTMCTVDTMVLRDSCIRGSSTGTWKGCLLETAKHANIGCLHISGMTLSNTDALVKHEAGTIGTLCLSDVACTGTGGPLVTGSAEIGEFHACGVSRTAR